MQFLQPRFIVFSLAVVAVPLLVTAFPMFPAYLDFFNLLLVSAVLLVCLGIYDITQTKHAILRNYPVIGHLRFFFEKIRPEMRQYFFETDTDGTPFSRHQRAIAYQRAKRDPDKRPFGTQGNVYAEGAEWMLHSIKPAPLAREPFRVTIGGPHCQAPYSASILNISALSYGALSANAIRALNLGAKTGGFAHDTGEGSISPYHREAGGDLIWQVGSGYFGCRDANGAFAPDRFKEMARDPQIKMIELKLSQGAKPGHGGVLPASKVTPEIGKIRDVVPGIDCISPAAHSAFSTPRELIQFMDTLRQLSGSKPVGFKFCVGQRREFFAILKAMIELDLSPDFIVIDGKEGGTGAAPAEFIDNIGMPLRDGLAFVHSALVGAGLRERIRIGCAGKIITGFDMARCFALGADWCNVGRGFMFAVGCIQAQTCHTGHCPTGVATQDAFRQRAIVVPSKADRVTNFHRETLHSLAELLAAAGLKSPAELRPEHIFRRASDGRIMSFADQFIFLPPCSLLTGQAPTEFVKDWAAASSSSF